MSEYKIRSKRKIWLFSLFSLLFFSLVYFVFVYQKSDSYLELIWGEDLKANELILNIMDTPIMKRIKDVDQSGPAHFFGPKIPKFTRFEHCVGVWALIKKAGVGINEQVAGLLHDVSYTVFSHVSDHLFARPGKVNEYTHVSYQDKSHMQYLKDAKLQDILSEYNIKDDDLDPAKAEYTALEQELPDMCADRIHYNIHTGIITGMISKSDARELIDDLHFEKGKWFFIKTEKAKRFAELSLYFTQNFWGSKWNVSMNMHLAKALKRAIHLKLMKKSDLYLTDSVVMRKLVKNQDSIIQLILQQCRQPIGKIVGQKYYTVKFIPKFRGIDPLVKIEEDGSLKRLTELDYMFKNHYELVKSWCAAGFDVEVLSIPDDDKDI